MKAKVTGDGGKGHEARRSRESRGHVRLSVEQFGEAETIKLSQSGTIAKGGGHVSGTIADGGCKPARADAHAKGASHLVRARKYLKQVLMQASNVEQGRVSAVA